MVDASRRAALLLGLSTPALSIEAFVGEPEAKPRLANDVQIERIATALEKLAAELRSGGVFASKISLTSDIEAGNAIDKHKLVVDFFLHGAKSA